MFKGANLYCLQANTPSVVNITNIRAMQSYYTMDIEKIPAGTGSGFIWDTKGTASRQFSQVTPDTRLVGSTQPSCCWKRLHCLACIPLWVTGNEPGWCICPIAGCVHNSGLWCTAGHVVTNFHVIKVRSRLAGSQQHQPMPSFWWQRLFWRLSIVAGW